MGEVAELQLELKKRQWLAALRWRSRIEMCLAPSGMTFTEWQVLDTTRSLVRKSGGAVGPNEVAKQLELDTMTLWHTMAVLEHRGLVSRDRSLSGKVWRVWVTRKGADLLEAVEPSLAGASLAS